MTQILIVSDRDAKRAGTYPLGMDPFVMIEMLDYHVSAEEWSEPEYKVTCSADDGTCRRWGIGETEYPLRDLIEHAETHVDLHARGDS